MQKTNFFFTLIAFFGAFAFTQAQFSGNGTGAVDAPYQITNATQLNEMHNFIGASGDNKHFQLMNNIDVSGLIETAYPVLGWLPIGTGSDDAESFHGFLHGGDFTISNLWMARGTEDNIGFFGCIKNGGVDHLNIQLDPVNGIIGQNNVGGLAGIAEATTITDSHVAGNITAAENAGGLIGTVNQDATIENNSATATILAGNNIGGLIGITSSPVSNCSSSGTVTTSGDYSGGLIGKASAAVSDSFSTADVTYIGTILIGNFMGGLVGAAQSTVNNCNASGAVNGTNVVGGLVGDSYALISNSHATGHVTANVYVGGLVGASDKVENCYATGTVHADQSAVGGLVGQSYGNVTKCYATGAVSGAKSVGGLIGTANMDVSQSYSSSKVTGKIPGTIPEGGLLDYGGLVGYSFGTISDCYATGDVYSPENSMYVGGLVGISTGSVTRCYASGSVLTDAYSMIGGLIGDAWAPVSNCVAANPAVGGLATGNLNNIHRLVGTMEFDGEIAASYALQSMRVNGDHAIIGTEDSMHGLNKTIEELQAQATYATQLNWNFSDLWAIREGHGYPYFGWREYFTNIISSSVNDELQGTITPIGDVAVEEGTDKSYSISPADGYEIEQVIVDGENAGTDATYLFSEVAANHTITVVFRLINLGTHHPDAIAVNIYPNPVKDVLNISYTQNMTGLELYNLLGQRVMVKTLNDTQARMDLSGLPNGTYLLKVASDKNTNTIKVVKQ